MLIKCTIHNGIVDFQKAVEIDTVDGVEYVVVSNVLIQKNALKVYAVGRKEGKLLVELPVESDSGSWQIWINEDQVLQWDKVTS